MILLVGNHDHQLQEHPEALAQVESLLAASGADVRFEYPGVWLRGDVYAQHGHYLDRHTTDTGVRAALCRRDVPFPAAALPGDVLGCRLRAAAGSDLRLDVRGSQTSEREIDATDGGGPHAP